MNGHIDVTNRNVDDSWYLITEHIWWQQLTRWWKLMCDDRNYCDVNSSDLLHCYTTGGHLNKTFISFEHITFSFCVICQNTCPKLGMLEQFVLKHNVVVPFEWPAHVLSLKRNGWWGWSNSWSNKRSSTQCQCRQLALPVANSTSHSFSSQVLEPNLYFLLQESKFYNYNRLRKI